MERKLSLRDSDNGWWCLVGLVGFYKKATYTRFVISL